jgi:hypothetical protein
MILIISILFHIFSLEDHPIHVSVSEVDIEKDKITWTARIYKDDLLLALYGNKANKVKNAEDDEIREDIYNYLSRKVTVQIQDDKLSWMLMEVQPDPEALYITLTAHHSSISLPSLIVKNQILLEVYRDQKNLVNFNWVGGKKNVVFESGDDQELILLP